MFNELKQKVNQQLQVLSQHELFLIDVERDEIYDLYIASLPEDRKQEHRCHCCRVFLRNYGHIVAIINNEICTMWDFEIEGAFSEVPKNLSNLLKSRDINNFFVTKITKLGTDYNHQDTDNGVIKWEHFYSELPAGFRYNGFKSIPDITGKYKTARDVFKRSLDELTIDATKTVLSLIKDNNLYRGDEHKRVLVNFLKYQKEYAPLSNINKDLYAWAKSKVASGIRNSAIGTLLINLSEGKPTDEAVRMFEALVAPHNYKRPKALVTPKMLEKAKEDITNLGLLDSLPRRHATIDDIPINDVLFVNRSSTIVNKSIFDAMQQEIAVSPKTLAKTKEVSIDDFVKNIIPTCTNIEVLMEGKHESNLMSVIAPEVTGSPSMFPWSNGLSWDYKGNVADSVKQRVKAQGGSVEGELRISLDWFNYDDLDLHVIEPNGNTIYYSNKRSPSSCGFLDVDMNAGGANSREAVENIIFSDSNNMLEGEYQVLVHNYTQKENKDFGFNIEIECKGELFTFGQTTRIRGHEKVNVATINYSKTKGITLIKGKNTSSVIASKEIWGAKTNTFRKVAVIAHSPNHWNNDEYGNRHTFFILDGVKNEESPRGFFNEFFKPNLLEHKKVFELMGNTMKVPDSDIQLSGLGFSSTKDAEVFVKVEGKSNQVYKIKF